MTGAPVFSFHRPLAWQAFLAPEKTMLGFALTSEPFIKAWNFCVLSVYMEILGAGYPECRKGLLIKT